MELAKGLQPLQGAAAGFREERVIDLKNHMRGQITFVNLLIILMIMFLFLAFLPAIISFVNDYAVPAIAGCPSTQVPVCPTGIAPNTGFNADQPTKDLLLAVIGLFPIALAVMIIASGLFYAIPRPER